MKLVNEKASIFETCVRFANNFLLLPDIDITFDDCPRVGTIDNAAESVLGVDGRGYVFINAVFNHRKSVCERFSVNKVL